MSCAIQLGRVGHSVILFEKETYPFHKVCGEYISLESWNHLLQLGVPLNEMGLPLIDTLFLTAPNGASFTTALPLGGFGISRYKLEHHLLALAKQSGVRVLEGAKVEGVDFRKDFTVTFASRLKGEEAIAAKICCGAFGKRSNLDLKWKRSFLHHQDKKLDNYVGIKYHVLASWKENVIGLHNFKNGYCGISKIEGDRHCLCYMTRAENLRSCHNDVTELERTILGQNPHLKKIFSECQKLEGFPLSIAQINFQEKKQIEQHVLMLGDAAGTITPLCGNGMSRALHTAKIAAGLVTQFLNGRLDRAQIEQQYTLQWQHHFAPRLQAGRTLQNFLGSPTLSNLLVGWFNAFPFLAKPVIRRTHGNPF